MVSDMAFCSNPVLSHFLELLITAKFGFRFGIPPVRNALDQWHPCITEV